LNPSRLETLASAAGVEGCRARGGALAENLFRDGLCLPSGSSLHAKIASAFVDVIRNIAAGSAPTLVSADVAETKAA